MGRKDLEETSLQFGPRVLLLPKPLPLLLLPLLPLPLPLPPPPLAAAAAAAARTTAPAWRLLLDAHHNMHCHRLIELCMCGNKTVLETFPDK